MFTRSSRYIIISPLMIVVDTNSCQNPPRIIISVPHQELLARFPFI